jgi:hypothetical protein
MRNTPAAPPAAAMRIPAAMGPRIVATLLPILFQLDAFSTAVSAMVSRRSDGLAMDPNALPAPIRTSVPKRTMRGTEYSETMVRIMVPPKCNSSPTWSISFLEWASTRCPIGMERSKTGRNCNKPESPRRAAELLVS